MRLIRSPASARIPYRPLLLPPPPTHGPSRLPTSQADPTGYASRAWQLRPPPLHPEGAARTAPLMGRLTYCLYDTPDAPLHGSTQLSKASQQRGVGSTDRGAGKGPVRGPEENGGGGKKNHSQLAVVRRQRSAGVTTVPHATCVGLLGVYGTRKPWPRVQARDRSGQMRIVG